MTLRFVAISDTHGRHLQFASTIAIPEGDVLIHCGDIDGQFKGLSQMLRRQPHRYKIIIPGNHDSIPDVLALADRSKNIFVLNDSCALIEGIRIYGHPWCVCQNQDSTVYPLETKPDIPPCDILMTHVPPFNILDLAWENGRVHPGTCQYCGKVHRQYAHWGSRSLREEIERVEPKFNIFGHVHDQPGEVTIGATHFINASSYCTEFHEPIVFNVTKPETADIPFQQLRSHTGTYLQPNLRMGQTPSPTGFRLLPSGILESETGRFVTVRNGAIALVRNERQAASFGYFHDRLLVLGSRDIPCLDVDMADPSSVIVWEVLGDSQTNQKWRFV